MNREGENAKLKEFLLGIEPATEEVGVQLIADPGFAEQMSLAEEELIEEFLDGDLTADEKALFYRNYLTTPERKALIDETALLRRYARRNFAQHSEPLPKEKKSAGYLEGLKGFLTLNWRPVAAVLVILIVAGIAWRVYFYDVERLTPIEREYAALNSKDLSGGAETAKLSSKSLAPGTFRDADSASRLSAASLTGDVLFRLALPAETPSATRFDLELVRGGQTVFRQTGLRVYQNPNGQELKVVLPRSVLVKGAYQLKLNTGATYALIVE